MSAGSRIHSSRTGGRYREIFAPPCAALERERERERRAQAAARSAALERERERDLPEAKKQAVGRACDGGVGWVHSRIEAVFGGFFRFFA